MKYYSLFYIIGIVVVLFCAVVFIVSFNIIRNNNIEEPCDNKSYPVYEKVCSKGCHYKFNTCLPKY